MSTIAVIVPATKRYRDYTEIAMDSVERQYFPVTLVYRNAEDMVVGQATNIGVARSESDYVMRLDADDWLHPACCMTMAAYLDTHPEIDAVYSDYWEADEAGNILSVQRQPEIPHPACMLVRRSVYSAIGGFDEDLKHQDGRDFWLRLVDLHRAHHLTVPLWYYRQHGQQMSKAHNTKVRIGHDIQDKHMQTQPRILCVIPARGGSKGVPRKNLIKLDGVPLVARVIRLAKRCRHEMLIVVSTEDAEIAALGHKEGVDVIDRPGKLSEDDVSLIPVAQHAANVTDWPSDIVVTLQPTSPLLKSETLDTALDKVMQPDVDSVVAVTELGRHPYRAYKLEPDGLLTPYFAHEAESYLQRQDRPDAYGFVGLYVRQRALLDNWNGRGFALGRCHGVVVEQNAGVDIDTPLDLWLAETIVQHSRETE